jgi:hypothetical protein
MKSFRRLSWGYIVALAAAVLMSASAQADTKHNRAVVRSIHGGAQVSNNKGQTWSAAKVGQFLGASSVIKTASDGTVDLFLGDNGPVVRVTPDSSMGIDKLDLDNTGIEKVIETQLDLRNGRILGSVKKMAAASKYEVKTPVGVAGIRGTEYSIDARGKVSIVTGSAVVVYVIDGVILAPVNVGAGQTVTPPASGGKQPEIGPSTEARMEGDLLRGVSTSDSGPIVVVIDNNQRVEAGINGNVITGGQPPIGPEGPGTLAPSPEPLVQGDEQHLPGETDRLVSQNTPTNTD